MDAEKQAMQRRIDTLDQHAVKLHAALIEAERENAQLKAELETVKRERDALLKYLTESRVVPCDICKHEPENGGIMACDRVRKVNGPCFEWRGLCKENGGKPDE